MKRRNDPGKAKDEDNTTFLLKSPPSMRIGRPRLTQGLRDAFMFGGEPLWRYLDRTNPTRLEEYRNRLQSLVKSFDSIYPPIKRPEINRAALRRIWAAAVLYLALRDATYLYSLSMDAAAIVDMYSVVERFTGRVVLRRISGKTRSKTVARMIERTSLPDLADMLREHQIWGDADIAVVRRLTKLRNGIAHRNEMSISKLLYSGKKISPLDIPRAAMRVDTPSIILASLRLILKGTESVATKRFRPLTRTKAS